METERKKRHFHIKFEVEHVGIFERWAWYVNRDSFVKSLAIEFEKKYPHLRIFINVLDFEEIKHEVPQSA